MLQQALGIEETYTLPLDTALGILSTGWWGRLRVPIQISVLAAMWPSVDGETLLASVPLIFKSGTITVLTFKVVDSYRSYSLIAYPGVWRVRKWRNEWVKVGQPMLLWLPTFPERDVFQLWPWKKTFLFNYYYTYVVYIWGHACHDMRVDVRG